MINTAVWFAGKKGNLILMRKGVKKPERGVISSAGGW